MLSQFFHGKSKIKKKKKKWEKRNFKTCNANHLKFLSFLNAFFFLIKWKEKIRKYLGFVPCQITSEEGRPDWMKCSSLSGEVLQCSPPSHLPTTLLKTGMTPWMGDTQPGCPGSVSPQAYDSSWEACLFYSHPANLRCCLTLCCWGTQTLPLDSHWQKIRSYYNKVAICLKYNVCISVGPGRHPYVPLLPKLALYFVKCRLMFYFSPCKSLLNVLIYKFSLSSASTILFAASDTQTILWKKITQEKYYQTIL